MTVEQMLEAAVQGGVAAKQTMPTQQPQIAGLAHCRLRAIDVAALIRLAAARNVRHTYEKIDFRGLEARDGQVEVYVELGDVVELEREQFVVPAGVLGEFVVGQNVSALLRFGHVGQAD